MTICYKAFNERIFDTATECEDYENEICYKKLHMYDYRSVKKMIAIS
ncbi:MAG: hypothetical protein NC548_22895 [Lachnospiraceae bacterium]|nr:hypothetical protein [Lachnospiraceae bacterium]